MCDEFQRISAPWERVFSESRKFGLEAVVASQQLGQLESATRIGLGNASCTAAFRLSHKDAVQLAQEFGVVTPRGFEGLSRGELYLRCEDDIVKVTAPPLQPVTKSLRDAIVERSFNLFYADAAAPERQRRKRKRTYDTLTYARRRENGTL